MTTTGLSPAHESARVVAGLCAAGTGQIPVTLQPSEDAVIEGNVSAAGGGVNLDSWRDEVSARLERYRTRRKPRTPRYPSLLLPFDAPESWSRAAPRSGSATAAQAQPEHDFAFFEDAHAEAGRGASAVEPASFAEPRRMPEQSSEMSAKVLEFPRSAAIPFFYPSELADPIFDRPRIVEAPEILPPPPALGGMLMEAQTEVTDRSAAEVSPLEAPASIGRRVAAVLVDSAILAAAVTVFAGIFLRLNPIGGSVTVFAMALGAAAVGLWMAYEFLFVVYTGSTPGLRVAKLRLARFDGLPLKRSGRRWRVLASFLSAFSAGLGYLWCVLDPDGLCWHDRITRTHVQSAAQAE